MTLYHLLAQSGISRLSDQKLSKRVSFSNHFSIFGASILLIWAVLFALLMKINPWPMFGGAAGFLAVLFLNRLGKHSASRLLLITIPTLIVTYYALLIGGEARITMIFIPYIALPFMLFDLKTERASLIYGILSYVGAYFFCDWYLAHHFAFSQVGLQTQKSIYPLIAANAFVISILATLYFYEINHHAENQLEKAIESLSDALQKLRETQGQLIQSGKLAVLGEMSGGMAHEINSPLTIISMSAAQMTTLLSSEPLDKNLLRETSKRIEVTTARIAKIIKALRAYSRVAEQDPIELSSVHGILRETLELCQEKFTSSGIEMTFDEPAEDLALRCRSAQIVQLLLSLMINAFDAVLSEREKWVRVATRALGSGIEISVTDSGAGIPPELREKIFQPFFTTKEIGRGMGLGLSSAKGMAESHGGTLTLDTSSPNTRFVLFLPQRVTQPRAASPRQA
jgi:signal transduction histidine kinase